MNKLIWQTPQVIGVDSISNVTLNGANPGDDGSGAFTAS